ncbi:hypothetical protein KEJ19_04995 [Candidatus Bathyarchaeota archaeon]|nr:hypothetical protein [Candidatus Bathyarchaeota archaeon]
MNPMKIRLLASPSNIVLLRHVMDYRNFRDHFALRNEAELHVFEKFQAARFLTENGCQRIYANVPIELRSAELRLKELMADVVGERDEKEVIVVFCEIEEPSAELLKHLDSLSRAENARVILYCPHSLDLEPILESFRDDFESGKFAIETFGFSSFRMEEAFKEALELIDRLCSETRVKMLLPLLVNPQRKSNYRKTINPKLLYENLSFLRSSGLIEELFDDEYALTPLGGRILCEYMAFVEKVRRTLEEARRQGSLGRGEF